jgi:hypothetical protein
MAKNIALSEGFKAESFHTIQFKFTSIHVESLFKRNYRYSVLRGRLITKDNNTIAIIFNLFMELGSWQITLVGIFMLPKILIWLFYISKKYPRLEGALFYQAVINKLPTEGIS